MTASYVRILHVDTDFPEESYEPGTFSVKDSKVYIASNRTTLKEIKHIDTRHIGSEDIEDNAIRNHHISLGTLNFMKTFSSIAWSPYNLANRVIDLDFDLIPSGVITRIGNNGNTGDDVSDFIQMTNIRKPRAKDSLHGFRGAYFNGIADRLTSRDVILMPRGVVILMVAKIDSVGPYVLFSEEQTSPSILVGTIPEVSLNGKLAIGGKSTTHYSSPISWKKSNGVDTNGLFIGGFIFSSGQFTAFNSRTDPVITPTDHIPQWQISTYSIGKMISVPSYNPVKMTLFRFIVIHVPGTTQEDINKFEGWAAWRYGGVLRYNHRYRERPPTIYD